MTRADVAAARPAPSATQAVPVLHAATASHPGRVRERNEDRVHADPDRGIFMVVDGIGGEVAGEKAAETAVEVMRRRLERRTGSPEERIREAIAVANNEIVSLIRHHPEWAGMGCVLTVAVVEEGHLTVGHVGDSRLYHLRAGAIEKITRDHSPVGEREDRGELGEREAMAHPRRNEVYRSVGAEERAPFDEHFVDVTRFPFGAGEALLMCSDGLTDLVSRDQIAAVVRAQADNPRAIADQLVGAALAAGGKDNVSVVFAAGRRFATEWCSGSRAAAAGLNPRHAAHADRHDEATAVPTRPTWLPYATGILVGAILAAGFLFAPRFAAPPLPGLILAPPAAHALRVGPDQSYRSIGDAMRAARAGDTVFVASGTYREAVRLGEGVLLIAARSRQVVIEPPTGRTDGGAAVIAEGIGAGAVRGITVHGGNAIDAGIRVSDAAVALDDVEVTGARVAGVLIENGRSVTVLASHLHDNSGAGVIVRAGGTARLAHNRIENNGRGMARSAGVLIEGLARGELDGNVIIGHAEGVRGIPRDERAAVLARNVFSLGNATNRVAVATLAPQARP